MNLKEIFGANLKNRRKRQKMPQEELAESIGVCPEFISLVERGINAPSFDTIERLADVLIVNPVEFFIPIEHKISHYCIEITRKEC